jgi:uncharacterized protein with von Willebrand factor type A (vWA) domain
MLNAEGLAARVSDRLAGFPAFLKANGFGVGAGDAVPVLRTAERVGVLAPALLHDSLRALLCGRADEWRRFPELFDAWFLPANRWQIAPRREAAFGGGGAPTRIDHGHSRAAHDDDAARAQRNASREELLRSADFRSLAAREHLLDIEALMRRLARRLKPLRLRREQAARRGARLDLPRTIRHSIGRGGAPIDLAWRQPRRVQPRLVLLIDVSRSMADTSFFYLRLARALAGEMHDVASFIFHTRLTAVTQALDDPDPWRSQERLHFIAQGFGGGTRIGECLAQFNREFAPRLVHGRTAVIVMSDGYDTGEPAQLAAELARLRRRARRIVWLHPLLGQADFEPVSAGMRAALPQLDLLAPGGSLADLQAMLPALIDALH